MVTDKPGGSNPIPGARSIRSGAPSLGEVVTPHRSASESQKELRVSREEKSPGAESPGLTKTGTERL